MHRVRKGRLVVALVVATALIGALAFNLLRTQAQARDTLRDSLDRRAALTARLIGSAFMASASSTDLRARYGGSIKSVAAHVEADRPRGTPGRLLVLDARGRVLAAAPPVD